MNRQAHRCQLLLLLLAPLLLRASIPDGYMPAPLAAGLPFVLCPSGVPAGFMATLSGSDQHRHHGHEGSVGTHVESGQCPIGHMLTPVAAFDDCWPTVAIPAPLAFSAPPKSVYPSVTPVKPRSRGPPA